MESNTPSIPSLSKPKGSHFWYITTALLVFLLVVSGGWNIYLLRTQTSANSPLIPTSSASGIFELQNAFMTGEITDINGNKVIIKNAAGTKGELRIADNFSINDLNENSATPSSELRSIKTNKLANINAQVINDEYQITSITYIQDAIDLTTLPTITTLSSPVPPVASGSAEE